MKRALVVLFALVAGCGRGSSESSGLTMTDCPLSGGVTAQCTTLEVAENPDAPEVRTLSLSVAVVPAREPDGRPPVVLIAGGPGQGAQSSYGAALSAFDAIRDHHDLILLDQRGTGRSHALTCEDTQVLDLKQAVSLEIDGPRLD
ncbi:MAG: alpha/beta hydrolase, partial [Nannocystaceae bacterium]|nr:alpha/beta hydrolase [Nannocystaceae bacterium]